MRTLNKYFLFLPLFILLSGCLFAQKSISKRNAYRVLDPSLKVVKTGYYYLVLKNEKGDYVRQEFCLDTREIVQYTTFKDQSMIIPHGPMFQKDDQGNFWENGNFSEGQRSGVWTLSYPGLGYTTGVYAQDIKNGTWTEYSKDSVKIKESLYRQGEVVRIVYFNPDGSTAPKMASVYTDTIPEEQLCDMRFDHRNACGADLMRQILNMVKYPRNALENNIQGTAIIRFTVDTKGEISNAKVINGVTFDLKNETKRVLDSLKITQMNTNTTEYKRVCYVIPIRFRTQ